MERRCHSSCGLLQGRRLPAVKGSVPALGAVLSDSEDVAVALVGRTDCSGDGLVDDSQSKNVPQWPSLRAGKGGFDYMTNTNP